jgi:hypothetical protein
VSPHSRRRNVSGLVLALLLAVPLGPAEARATPTISEAMSPPVNTSAGCNAAPCDTPTTPIQKTTPQQPLAGESSVTPITDPSIISPQTV